MPTPDLKPGSPCWIDLMTSDTAKAREFYGGLFGWEFQEGNQDLYGGYITATKGGQSVAGIMLKQEDQGSLPDLWSTYLMSRDAAATAATVPVHGGQVYMEPMEVPAQGVIGFVADPSGAAISIWESRGKDETAQAGIIDASGYLPEDIPSHRVIYFAVDDADATVEHALAMGATLLDGPEDSPHGRIAALSDPTGAMFKISGENTPN